MLTSQQSPSGAAGALFQKLATWGRVTSSKVLYSGPERDGSTSSEAAAALRGKAAGGDTRLLHSLFGSPQQQPTSGEERRTQTHTTISDNESLTFGSTMNAPLGEAGGILLERKSEHAFDGGENLRRPESPMLGIVEEQAIPPNESLI